MKRSRKPSNNPVELAVSRFEEGFNCSQSVFSAFCTGKRIPETAALGIASPFGAGIGRTGGLCGALTGGVMAIGLRHGHTSAKALRKKESVYLLTREFLEAFRVRNGSTVCKELLGCDLSTPEGFEKAKANDYHHTRCPKFVRDAAAIVAELQGRRKP